MKIHVYEVTRMFVVEVDEPDERIAIAKALESSKRGLISAVRPDCKMFGVRAPEAGGPVQRTKAADIAWLVRALLQLNEPALRRVAVTAGLSVAGEPVAKSAAWVAELMNRAKREDRLVDLSEAAAAELAAGGHPNASQGGSAPTGAPIGTLPASPALGDASKRGS